MTFDGFKTKVASIATVPEAKKPTPKVGASALAGALSVVLIYVVSLFGVEIPGGVGAAIATVFTFIAGYFISEE